MASIQDVSVPSLLGTIHFLGMSWYGSVFLVVCCLRVALVTFCLHFLNATVTSEKWSRQHLDSHGISVSFIAEIYKEDLGITCTQCQLTAERFSREKLGLVDAFRIFQILTLIDVPSYPG